MQSLDLQNNAIGDSGALSVAAALRVNRNLRILVLSYNGIGSKGATAIVDALFVPTPHSEWALQVANFQALIAKSSASAAPAAVFGSPFPPLTELHLLNNDIGDAGLTHLAAAVQEDCLHSFDRCAGYCNDADSSADAPVTASALLFGCALRVLDIRNCGGTEAGARVMREALTVARVLTEFRGAGAAKVRLL